MADLPAAFGKYILTEKIATGGMAEIYLAKLVGPGGFEKPLVIKQILPELGQSPRFVDLFVAEAKTLVGLTHGNIVPIYELGVVGDTYFIAMEYIDGPTLDELCRVLARRGETLEPACAAYLIAELLEGLDYAHRKDVLHRDLSPRNVMVTRDGEIKLVDFGLATALGGDGPDPLAGAPAGSFPYMSPEQVSGGELDRRSDVFAAGVLFWELLAGRSLFSRDDADATLEAVKTAPVPPASSVRPEVPEALDEISSRALERDPDARFPTAAEFLAEINRYLYALDQAETPASLARLVARVCPPEVRGAPRGKAARRAAPSSGPVTKPMAKEEPRVETFATRAGIDPPERARAGGSRRRRAAWGGAALAGVAVLIVGLALGPLSPSRGEAPAGLDQQSAEIEPAEPRESSDPISAAPRVAAIADAAPVAALEPDAGRAPATAAEPPPDAPPSEPPRGRRAADAGSSAALRAPAPEARTGRLTVGADPWADVYVAGRLLGRAPGAFELPAGDYRVTVIFPPEDRRRGFDVSIEADGTTSLGIVDFTVEPEH